ncbi:DUF6210 family protein [Kitasatospora sp. NPDC096147]|uniref:DUF6210 family protein n=1 Tax=Kitasatospora sp. NPDC096147 TaxID=3364093 RepID=UPI0037F8DD22
MSPRRHVALDPDGMSAGGWLFVVVEAGTRVVYHQQYGVVTCRQGQVEGFLVPLHGPEQLAALRELFEGHFGGAGTWGYRWPEGDAEGGRLRAAVEAVQYWASDGTVEAPYPLRLDESRIGEADEAWLPVVTPDGPGVLVWFNSD